MNNIFETIDNSENNLFRNNNVNDEGYIHDNQIKAAKEIVKSFFADHTRRNHVILLARMQSGKTGVCNATVNIINKLGLNKQMGIDKFFFISGMNDCGLKQQTYERLISQVVDARVDNTYFGKRKSRFNTVSKYFVLKNSDLVEFSQSIDGSVIFIDESHYGSKFSNVLTKFLLRNNIDWKDTNELIKRNIYIVSVSATPFSELISDTKQCKQCIELETDDEYVGLSQYEDAGLIHNGLFFDKVYGITRQLAEALSRMRDAKGNDFKEYGVCFVRTSDFEELKNDEFVQYNFDIHEMCSNGNPIEYQRLIEKLRDLKRINDNNRIFANCKSWVLDEKIKAKPLLVLIKGAYRAGITLPSDVKDLVYMVYDYSVKATTTAQALLGRMCGYRSKGTELKTHFYVNTRAVDMYSTWEKNFSDRANIPCDKMTTEWLSEIDYSSVDTDFELSSKSCGNFTIDLSDSEIEYIYSKCKGKKTCHENMKLIFNDLLEKRDIDIHYDYFHEAHVQGKNNYAASSQTKRFDSFTSDSLVFGFRPDKMKEFMDATGRDYLTKEDFGKRCVSVVLDADIDKESGKVIGGNGRLLVYYVEVGAFHVVPSKSSMYESWKDTDLDKK